jgi:hypothetical protein
VVAAGAAAILAVFFDDAAFSQPAAPPAPPAMAAALPAATALYKSSGFKIVIPKPSATSMMAPSYAKPEFYTELSSGLANDVCDPRAAGGTGAPGSQVLYARLRKEGLAVANYVDESRRTRFDEAIGQARQLNPKACSRRVFEMMTVASPQTAPAGAVLLPSKGPSPPPDAKAVGAGPPASAKPPPAAVAATYPAAAAAAEHPTPALVEATNPPPAATGSTADYHDKALESLAARLPQIPVGYNKPKSLEFDRDTEITLIVETASAKDALAELQTFSGEKVSGVAKLAPDVEAVLSGPPDDVVITPRQNAAQKLTEIANVQWIWDVKAKHPGSTTLTLDLWTTVHASDGDRTVRMRTFRDTIPIHVSRLQWLTYEIDQIDPVWKALIAAVTAIGGALTAWGVLKKKKP